MYPLPIHQNLQQDILMEFYKHLAYEASAGSGKTFALVIRYISLLYLGAKPNSILILTFTNKAANEMRERINVVLKELKEPKRETELDEISKTTGLSKDEIVKNRSKIYQEFLKSDLKISTIDKFFAQILRKFSLNIALMPDFQIEEEADEQKFIESFLREVKQHDKYKDLIKFAVAESKKLGSIFQFLEYLYAKDGEIKDLQPTPITEDNTKKILSLAKRLEELFLSCEQLSPSGRKSITVKNLDDLLSKSWLTKDSLDYHFFRRCFTPLADEIFFELKDALKVYFTNKDAYLKHSYLELYQIYKNTKRSQNITQNRLSFNDVTNSVYELLRENIESDFLYFRLDAKIDHILIDEFQDTNVIQYKILEPILDEISSGIGTKEFKTLFYVGDIKQSIYRFRGGAKELFHHVQKSYNVKLLALTTNYRSKAGIVSFVNDSFRDKIVGYKDQNFIGEKDAGYVKVTTTEELLDEIVENLFMLIEAGVQEDDIAILTYTNSDAFVIEEALLNKDATLKITTQTSSKLINDPTVSAIIEFLKYLYFKENLYKANFLTSLGLSWDESLKIKEFDRNQDLLTLVKNIINHFKLYNNNSAIFKFLETLSSYKNIEAFLFESEELAIESPSKKQEGIKILTIHKSKGLEFDHVIVADRFKKPSADRSSLIFEYDDIELKDIHVRIKNRDHFDQKYAAALEAEKKLSQDDALNLLYVAFTRAKESLIVCQNDTNSSFSILSLLDGEIGTITPSSIKKEVSKEESLEYESIKLGLQEQKLKNEKEKTEDFEAIHFGTALHYMLEILESFEERYIDDAYWSMKNRFEIFLEPNRCEEIKTRVSNLLKHQPFLELIDGKLYKEQPISFNGELKQLDLLIEHDDKWIIIDYKSSATKRSEHVVQVLNYKKAIKKIVDKDVFAYLCYIRDDEIELLAI
jgi:exodeoxyribonuclease V beta subunit